MHFAPFSLLFASSSASLSAATSTVEVITFSAICAVFSAASSAFATAWLHVAPKAYSDNPSPHPDTGIGNIRPPL